MRKKIRDQGLSELVQVDSAGTHNYHPQSPPDERSQKHAAMRGYDLSDLRARQISPGDFEKHDLILVMDRDNLEMVQRSCPARHQSKLRRLTEFSTNFDSPIVPDPYYGGTEGFVHVLDLVEDACDGLIGHIRKVIN